MSVPAPRDTICFNWGFGEGLGSDKKALVRMSRALVRVYVPLIRRVSKARAADVCLGGA